MVGQWSVALAAAALAGLMLVGAVQFGLPHHPDAFRPVATPPIGKLSSLVAHDVQPPPIEPRLASGGGQGRILVQSGDPNVVPNDGVRVNLTGFGSAPEPAQSSFQVGVEEVIGNYEAVFGLFSNSGTAPTPFFSVFTNQTDVNVRLGYWPSYPVIQGQTYDFGLLRSNATRWSLTVNGQLFGGNLSAGSFDFGATTATWPAGLSFSEVAIYQNVTTVPNSFTVPLALAVHRGGAWYLPTSAAPTYIGAGGAAWGVGGRLQHTALHP